MTPPAALLAIVIGVTLSEPLFATVGSPVPAALKFTVPNAPLRSRRRYCPRRISNPNLMLWDPLIQASCSLKFTVRPRESVKTLLPHCANPVT